MIKTMFPTATLLLCVAVSVAPAQTTFASITGRVIDASGAVIPKVTITARNTETNIVSSGESNETGNYTISQLKEGTYELRAQVPGFKEFVAKEVILESRDIRRVDIALEVGTVDTRVEVTAGTALIETETARIGDRKNDTLMRTLPIFGGLRTIYPFLSLSPGVLQAAGSSTIRFAGSRTNQQNWSLDGTTMVDGVGPTQVGPLANFVEFVEEVKIDIANNTAEFGTIGQVTLVSKSGTNALHGAAFDYYRTPWFRARNPFALVRSPGVQHLPGVSLGGPVLLPRVYDGRNKTFFYFSLELNKGSASSDLLNPTVPIPDWRAGDFSGLSGGTLIYDPLTGSPFPVNRIPADRINPVSQRIQERFYPAPNFGSSSVLGSQNYRETKMRPYDPNTYWTVRGDHHFSSRDSIFGRYNWQRGYFRPYEGNLPTIGRRDQQRNERAATVSYTHIFNPSLLSEARWGFALSNNNYFGPLRGPDVVQDFGLIGLAPDLPDLPGIFKVNWSGLGLTPISQIDYNVPGYRTHGEEWQDHVSWFRGRHSFKFGVSVIRSAYDSIQTSPNLYGNATFSSLFTSGGISGHGHPYADFLLGIPTSVSRSFPPIVVYRNRWQYDFFAVDDFKINAKLTLNLGIRYEVHAPWGEKNRLLSTFDVGSGSIVVANGALSRVSALFPDNYVGIVEAEAVGLPGRTLIRTDNNNFAPRIGIAYRPWGAKTVIRAGYGIFYDVVPRLLTVGGIPFVLNEPAYTNPSVNPTVILPRVFPSTGAAGPSAVTLPSAVDPGIGMAYSMQYNFTMEHQLRNTGFRLSYIGTNARQGHWSYNYNSPVPDERLFVDKPRPFPNYPGISYFASGAGHQYHSLTAVAERRMTNGLYFQGSWVWARDIYDLDPGQAPENPFDRKRERAVARDIPTHRITSNWIYELPFGRGRVLFSSASRLLDLAIGGWEVNGIYSHYSGEFLTPLWTGPDPTGTAYTTSRTPANVTIRPDQIGDPNLPEGQRSVARWFDAAAFAPPAKGRFGSAAKGTIKGPGVNILHGGLAKRFALTERMKLRWEMTATNLLNHPNYSNPVANITQSANVGTISGVGGVNGSSTGDAPGARVFQMGLRLTW
jgi:hypothetical protein